MPIYEYRCQRCGKRSTALLPSWSAPDPACPHCGAAGLRRLVSTFAAPRSGDDADTSGLGEDEDGGGGDFGDDEGGFGEDDF